MKALFCGLGSIGQRHLRNLRELLGESVEVHAFRQRRQSPVLNADMTVRKDATIEETYGIRTFDDLGDALAEHPDAVFITNPNTLHMPVAIAAAKAGCHLFIEKPVSHDLAGIAELEALVQQQRLKVFVAYQFRFHPALRSIKALLDEGRLGQILSAHVVNGERLPDWHPYEDYRETHPARRDLGGGCLRIQTHELDYALWLFGRAHRVMAMGGHLSSLEVDVEDSVDLLVECQQGGQPFPVHIHLDYCQRPPQRVCEIIGDRGKIRYDYYENRLEFHDLESRETIVDEYATFERNRMFLDELSHFLECVAQDRTPSPDLREGLRSLRLGLAAEASLTTGRPVPLDGL